MGDNREGEGDELSEREQAAAESSIETRDEGTPRTRGHEPASTERDDPPEAHAQPALVVALGASAGGLDALQEFFDAVTDADDTAFLVVTHQHPGHESLMPELLGRHTEMPVQRASDGLAVRPGHVYVAPPQVEIVIEQGTLWSAPPKPNAYMRLPIDVCFRSLASDQGRRAACVVLSGNGSDGTLGLKAVKAEGGFTMAQEPSTAAYTGMPSSAVHTGQVDYVLPPGDMPERLRAHAETLSRPRDATRDDEDEKKITRILKLLRGHTGHDFGYYKPATVRRRIERRMNVYHLRDPSDYIAYLQANPQEFDLLFRELLIGVTCFFRDPAAFEALKHKALYELIAQKSADDPIRVWVAGCSTGEEAYSVAILLRECMDETGTDREVQIFASDLDRHAIETARTGLYPAGIAADVSAERLDRFFTEEAGGYRVREPLRDMVIFAVQNLISDPPFTRLDLLVCRNLLIYLDNTIQAELLRVFEYALRPQGVLFVGNAESLGPFDEDFAPIDKKSNLYRRRETTRGRPPYIPRRRDTERPSAAEEAPRHRSTAQVASQVLLDHLVPPSVIVDEHGEIVHIHGRTGAFLEPAAGAPSMNVFQMAREGLRLELMAALRQAAGQREPVVHTGIPVHQNGATTMADLTVRRVFEPPKLEGMFVVSFMPRPEREEPDVQPAETPSASVAARIQDLEEELRSTKEALQSTIEEYETANEELKSSNEELQSTNEELQSTNEELETAKEEQQSLNEELQTVNSELQQKIDNLSQAHDDMRNLLYSSNVATLFLDAKLRIKRFTPNVTRIANLLDADVGRPLADLQTKLEYGRLDRDADEVLRTLVYKERDIRGQDGSWYRMRTMPYRTSDDVIDGIVMTFIDITDFKRQAERPRQALAQELLDLVEAPVLFLDRELRVVAANRAAGNQLHIKPRDAIERSVFEIGSGELDRRDLRDRLKQWAEGSSAAGAPVELELEAADGGIQPFVARFRGVEGHGGSPEGMILWLEPANGSALP